MLGDLPAYEAYGESPGTWVPPLPAHWPVQRGGIVLPEVREMNKGLVESTVLSLSFGRVVVKPSEKLRGLVPESFEGYQVVKPGDVVIRPTDLQNDQTSLRVGAVRTRGIITSAYVGLRPTAIDPDYAFHYLAALDHRKVFYGMGSGLRQTLDYRDFKRLPLPVPPAEEQAAIVTYLGHAHARIDRVIAAKRDLIALLGEQKRAVAHEVLRETDGGARALKHVLRQLIDCEHKTAPRADGDFWILRTSAIRAGDINWNGAYTTDAVSYGEWTSRGKPEAGDVIFTREAPVGEAAVIPEGRHTALGQRTVLMKLRRDLMDPSFLVHQIYSGVPRDRITLATQGSTVGHFNMDDIGWMRVVVPPLAAQREMVGRISAVTSASDEAIARARSEIELLREFRTRLTADIVTGQVDVRSAAATLPPLDPHDVPLDVENGEEDEADDVLDPVEDA